MQGPTTLDRLHYAGFQSLNHDFLLTKYKHVCTTFRRHSGTWTPAGADLHAALSRNPTAEYIIPLA
jgi:hypothetical protein